MMVCHSFDSDCPFSCDRVEMASAVLPLPSSLLLPRRSSSFDVQLREESAEESYDSEYLGFRVGILAVVRCLSR